MTDLVERLRKHFYKLPDGFYSDTDYGCNENHPESLIMAILDHGPQGTKVMQELTACGFSIVETEAVEQAASTIEALSERIAVLEEENARQREALWSARQQAKRRGKDILQDEADAVLPHFRNRWEPLRTVAQRTGHYSAQQLASRARDLCKRGLVEQRWNDGVMRISEWRATGGRSVPITVSGQVPLTPDLSQ